MSLQQEQAAGRGVEKQAGERKHQLHPTLGPNVLKCSLEEATSHSFHLQSYCRMTVFDVKKIRENDLRQFV